MKRREYLRSARHRSGAVATVAPVFTAGPALSSTPQSGVALTVVPGTVNDNTATAHRSRRDFLARHDLAVWHIPASLQIDDCALRNHGQTMSAGGNLIRLRIDRTISERLAGCATIPRHAHRIALAHAIEEDDRIDVFQHGC